MFIGNLRSAIEETEEHENPVRLAEARDDYTNCVHE